jgi:ribosome-associated toxin RatA of RatAB toxin-antitoxin module
MSEAVRESIVVAADPDTIMDVIADFEAYPDWQKEFKEAEILESDADGWGTKVRYKVDAKVISAEYVLAYTYTDNEMRWELVDGDQLRKNEGTYTLEDQGDGTTLVTYELEVETSIPMPGMLRRKAAKRIVDGALKDMKQRVERGS